MPGVVVCCCVRRSLQSLPVVELSGYTGSLFMTLLRSELWRQTQTGTCCNDSINTTSGTK